MNYKGITIIQIHDVSQSELSILDMKEYYKIIIFQCGDEYRLV